MLGILLPLILLGQLASGFAATKNIKDYGDSVIHTDLENGYQAALQSLDNYFWMVQKNSACTWLRQLCNISGKGLQIHDEICRKTAYRRGKSRRGEFLCILQYFYDHRHVL